MTHGPPTNAYSFVKKGNLRIDKSKLKKLKITPGKHLMMLKQGKDMVYNGKKYKAKDLTYKADETKVSFILDTSLNKKISSFVKNSDLLISEATFSKEEEDRAKEHGHLSSAQAAEIAKKAKVKKMFITHLSQRYEKNPEKILVESKKIFKNTFLANDLEKIELS
jgi:ribonuclease Z